MNLSNCCGITLKNKPCKKRKMGDRYCNIHYKECSICCDEINEPVKLDCNHSFCKECIYHWLVKAGNCPYCRTVVSYPRRLDAINHNIYNGKLITVTSYRFSVDTVLFPDFVEYTQDLIDFDTYINRNDWDYFKFFVGIDEHIYRVFRNMPRMKFVSYLFVDDYTDNFPVEIDENDTKNVYKYKIELI